MVSLELSILTMENWLAISFKANSIQQFNQQKCTCLFRTSLNPGNHSYFHYDWNNKVSYSYTMEYYTTIKTRWCHTQQHEQISQNNIKWKKPGFEKAYSVLFHFNKVQNQAKIINWEWNQNIGQLSGHGVWERAGRRPLLSWWYSSPWFVWSLLQYINSVKMQQTLNLELVYFALFILYVHKRLPA